MNERRQRFLTALAASGLLALSSIGWSQDADLLRLRLASPEAAVQRVVQLVSQPSGDEEKATDRWIGVHVSELPPVLKKHLQLEHGVLAEDVLPDAPAAKAGIEQFDVLLAVEGKEIKSPEDVRDAVAAADEGQELSIKLLHEGKETTVKVVPAPRPADRVIVNPTETPSGAASSQQEFLRHQHQAMKALERALADRQAAGMMFMRPGIVAHRPLALPKGVKVTVTHRGGELAKIVVERGDERWDVTENSLDTLPEELRAPVAALVQGPTPFTIKLKDADDVIRVAPKGFDDNVRVEITPPKVRQRAPKQADDDRMDDVLRELKSLRKQLEEVQRQLPDNN